MASTVPVRLRVAGLSFRAGYPGTILELAERVEQHEQDEISGARDWSDLDVGISGPEVMLVRDPENEHDPNAIEVHVPCLGRRQFVGFVPKERDGKPCAARLAALLDDGEMYKAFVTAVPIDPNYIDRPGLEIEIRMRGQKHLSECATRNPGTSQLGCTCHDYSPEWTI